MAVIFAVVGGGAVFGIATTPGETEYSDSYSDYLNYSSYDNYSDYSDEAERRQKRIEAKKSEIKTQKEEINSYKAFSVNSYLQSGKLIKQSGVSVSVPEVRRDGDRKIDYDIKCDSEIESAELTLEIEEISAVINKIDEILEGGE